MERIPTSAAMATTPTVTRHILAAVRPSTGLRIAQAIGLTSTAFLAGQSWALSVDVTPALLDAPRALLLEQWVSIYTRITSIWIQPTVVLASSSIFAYSAYLRHGWDSPRVLYMISAGLTLGIAPYSALILKPVAEQLEKKFEDSIAMVSVEEVTDERQNSVHELVDQWAMYHAGRCAVGAVAAICATWATLGQIVEVVAIPS